jgi:putative ABC transport system ATP-binding protein
VIGDFASSTELTTHWNAFPFQLSGGEAARAGIAVALAAEQPVLLCDEPTAEVDASSEEAIICRSGVAILVATHSNLVAGAADRIVHLVDGRLAPN